ncbi:Stk1 family PASTA domain-containing Ser/Thr kinase [Garciella nitratireducens]|uniref:non-specific serine/threonine protein kinase n=1 Tax=Garciella nitratireducens DSM 15102 TaxID=1121911 RepID=A0A1T4JYY1_9FIRM|nr:Stk1 family PASTA domain-containing Ser/Thr kinase [Garciella nitratireducens]RBP41110.1 serine/threonine protein kinase [Garciella nitratireducens]SJZ35426.1 serine/threonine protein kinase [Garciella nitratireducens DSM 15102]
MLIGKILSNRYEIIEQIGQGGMAIVYKARDQLLNRYVAIKVLRPEFVNDEQFIKKFKRESQAAASLSHHNIVNIYDIGVQENIHYIVMELINGKTLKEFIQQNGRVDWKKAVHIAIQIASALEHAHKNHIIHRDIKPHNIILTQEEVVKVADFGIARAITSSTITQVTDTMGSVHYLSPEQARGGFVNEKSDLYSLGIVLYEMITGEVPFKGDTSVTVALKHIQEEVVPPIKINPSIPESLNLVILRLLKKNPDERYANASVLIKDLNHIYLEPETPIMQNDFDENAPTQVTPIIGKIEEGGNDNKEDKQKYLKHKKTKKFSLILSLILVFLIASILGALAYSLKDYFNVNEVKVPNVENLSIDDAIDILNQKNLRYQIVERKNSTEFEKNIVISQDPKAGEVVKENQIIKLVISEGAQKIMIPNLIGQYESEAINQINNLGLEVGEVKYEYNNEYEKGVVFHQNPDKNVEVEEGTKINLYVSKGKETIKAPSLIGKHLEEAKEILNSMGLNIGKIEYKASDTYEKDIVINQNPKPNGDLSQNSAIDIILSSGKVTTKNIQVDLKKYKVSKEENIDQNNSNNDDKNLEEKSSENSSEENNSVKVTIELTDYQDNTTETVYQKQHLLSEGVLQIPIQGTGIQIYTVKINDKIIEQNTISFE